MMYMVKIGIGRAGDCMREGVEERTQRLLEECANVSNVLIGIIQYREYLKYQERFF